MNLPFCLSLSLCVAPLLWAAEPPDMPHYRLINKKRIQSQRNLYQARTASGRNELMELGRVALNTSAALKELMAAYPYLINQQDAHGNTPLMLAIAHGAHPQNIAALQASPVLRADIRNDAGYTAADLLRMKSDSDGKLLPQLCAPRPLFAMQADSKLPPLKLPDEFRKTVDTADVAPRIFELVKSFRQSEEGLTREAFAALLRESGADVNARESVGNTTVLMTGLLLVDPEWMVEELLAAGADPNLVDAQGMDAFQHRLIADDYRACEALLKCGYQLPASERLQFDLLNVALYGCGAFEILKSAGVDINMKHPETGLTLLQTLIRQGAHAYWLEALLRAGANPDACEQGEPPLMLALAHRDEEVTCLLLRYGATVCREEMKHPLLMDAIRQGDETHVERLLQMGAPVHACEKATGLTPLKLALRTGHQPVAALLMEAVQGRLRHNNDYMELCQAALAAGDCAFFSNLPEACLNEHCGAVDSPFAAIDGYPKTTHYFASPLVHAAAAGKTDIVRVLLQRGADKEADEHAGRTALIYAAAGGHVPCVELLYQNGAAKGGVALQAALYFKQNAVANYLLAQGVKLPPESEAEMAALMQRTPTGETQLMLAVKQNNPERVSYILGLAPQLVNAQDSYGRTALMMATNADIVKALLDCGADASIKNDSGLTALDAAYQAFLPEVVQALQRVNTTSAQDYYALRFACRQGDVELARRILTGGGAELDRRAENEESLLVLAVRSQSTEMVQLLLAHGVRPQRSGALRCAVQQDQPQLVRLLMAYEHVCPASSCMPRGGFSDEQKLNALLHTACRENALKTVRMLLEMGVDVNDAVMSSYGYVATGNTPLHDAVRASAEMISLLLDAGADINARDAQGNTPLMLAVWRLYGGGEPYSPSDKMGLLLLDRGADAFLTNKEGRNAADMAWMATHVQALEAAGVQKTPVVLPPLVQAVYANDKDRMRELLAAGAEPDSALPGGKTLLQWVVREGGDDYVEAARILLENGANPQLCRKEFEVAMGRAHLAVARLLLQYGFKIQERGVETFEYLSRAARGYVPTETLPLLAAYGASPEATNELGLTVLMDEARSSYYIEHRVHALLALQPNLEAELNGVTALGMAVEHGNMLMALHLLRAGAKAHPQQISGIFFYVLREHPEYAAELIDKYGASPTAPEPSTGLTPLDIAIRSGHLQLMSVLQAAQTL